MVARVNTVHPGADALGVDWPDGTHTELPYLWLRDNCPCDDCRCLQTTEKRFMLTEVPADLKPADTRLDGDTLVIRWPDDHVTRFDGARVRACAQPRPRRWQPWRAGFKPLRTPFDAFVGDDAVATDTIDAFEQSGVFILVEAPTEPGTLERLAPRFGPVREVLFARIHDVLVDPKGYNVAHTPMALPPHNDFASYTWPPSVQALHMLANETRGGESIVVDGWAVLDALRCERPDDFTALREMPVPFREFDDDNETFCIEPIVRCDADGEICHLRFSNQLMQPPDPTRPGMAAFYRAYRELCVRLTDRANWSTFRLEAGHILVVAGHRVLHAREAFEPVGRRHLQDAYFEYDNIVNHRVVLANRDAGGGHG